jgi:predicted nucleic acid-binding protein
MIYLDTNILLYATLTKVDTQSQQDRAIEILKELIDNEFLLLSNLNLLEYAFVMKKAKEDSEKIESALELFQSFVKDEKEGFSNELMQFLDNDYAFKNSFDLYHVAFANSYGCEKLITFDKGFKKFRAICRVEIEILK